MCLKGISYRFIFTGVLIWVTGFSIKLWADEGMWTLDGLPKEELKKKYNFEPTEAWIKKIQLSAVRLANGCSGGFVSKKGLVMTNHHCVRSCVQHLSSSKKDYIAKGFLAKNHKGEKPCPALEVNRLVETTDITDEMKKATKGLRGKKYAQARKVKMAEVEKKCAKGQKNRRCDVVSLYHGGQYKLYKYQRYQDVRLVFAPEQDIAHFGGDPDNFNFPRYCLDMSFLRVYENGKPLDNEHHFNWSKKPIKDGDMTFVVGHPGRTDRLLTLAQLRYKRDVSLVDHLIYLSELRGLLTEYQKKGPEEKRTANGYLARVENGFKSLRGQLKSLQDKGFWKLLVRKEKALRAQGEKAQKFSKNHPSPWKEIAQAVGKAKRKKDEINYIGFHKLQSNLFWIARTLVRASDEMKKPNSKRLREFTEAKLPQLRQRLMSSAPIYPKLEKAQMAFALTKMREALSPDHPFVKKVLGKKSPQQVAEKLIQGTKLANVSVRKELFKGGKKAIRSSKDPMILMALIMDPDSRRIRKYYENQIEAQLNRNSEKIAQIRFKAYGKKIYPDATFSLRISYGRVKGYKEKGQTLSPLTHVAGVYDRNTGSPPFALPASWMKARNQMNKKTPFNFASTNDIIGGNSGSPVLNRKGEVVGLIFDGNIHSLGGGYGFDPFKNRAVSVHGSVMMESLNKIYKAGNIIREILE